MSDYSADLQLALDMADKADKIAMSRLRATDLKIESKPDMSPVTDADQAIENMIRQTLANERPEDKILGEEYGGDQTADRHWIIDPIDGTKNYLRKHPFWGTLIALSVGGEIVVGVASAPLFGNRWWARKGAGAWNNGGRIETSEVKSLDAAFVSYGGIDRWLALGKIDRLSSLVDKSWRDRGTGDFVGYMLVAEGVVDIAVQPEGEHIWDIAPAKIIVKEAGGITSAVKGYDPEGSFLATNGHLHKEAQQILSNNAT